MRFRNLVNPVILSTCFLVATVAQAQQQKPLPAPASWRPLLGEYVNDDLTIMILEKDGKLSALYNRSELAPMREISRNVFEFDSSTKREGGRFVFLHDTRGRVNQFRTGHMFFKRKPLGPEEGANQLKVDPLRANIGSPQSWRRVRFPPSGR